MNFLFLCFIIFKKYKFYIIRIFYFILFFDSIICVCAYVFFSLIYIYRAQKKKNMNATYRRTQIQIIKFNKHDREFSEIFAHHYF